MKTPPDKRMTRVELVKATAGEIASLEASCDHSFCHKALAWIVEEWKTLRGYLR